MNITIDIPGMSELAAAINNLAAAYGTGLTASAEGNSETPKPRGRPRKATDTPTADAGGTPSGSDTGSAASGGTDEPQKVVDAGTGQTVVIDPKEVQSPSDLTDERKAEIKGKAARLTQIDGGNAMLTEMLGKYGAPSFGKVPADKLLSLEADIDGALALA